jgi:hypothetical protein
MGLATLERIALMCSPSTPIVRLISVLLTCAGSAVADDAIPTVRPTTIVVIGAGGAPQYDALFDEWGNRWIAAATQSRHEVVVVGREDDASQTDRQRLQTALQAAAKTPAVDLWLVLIGHGTYDRREARFNLRGPDISAKGRMVEGSRSTDGDCELGFGQRSLHVGSGIAKTRRDRGHQEW